MSNQIAYTIPNFDRTPINELNPENRCACVLLLDTSGSMSQGNRIAEMEAGVREFKDALLSDSLARKRVEIAVVTFGGTARVVTDFVAPDEFELPRLVADGATPMGAGIHAAIDLLEERKHKYKASGLPYYRPWVILMTDGEPTDGELWRSAADRVHVGESPENKAFVFYAFGVGDDAKMDVLSIISVRTPMKVRGVAFRELFAWLSASIKMVSSSTIGDKLAIGKPGDFIID